MELINIQRLEKNLYYWLAFLNGKDIYNQYVYMNQNGYTINDMRDQFKHRMYGKC